MAASLRERKIDALRRMLNFNDALPTNSSSEIQWKVLVYDSLGQDIISPLLNVKELRDLGVTLHLLIHSEREQIPDVPAVYFVHPTSKNIQRICKDIQNGLYESYYFNFISPISRQLLEEIAQAALNSGAVQQVSKVFDQYTNFISLEEDLFVLRHQNAESISYFALNRKDMNDSEMGELLDSIVDSLFSVFVTMGTVPIIRCPRGNAAEMVAQKLDKKLRDNLRDTRNSLFTGELSAGQFTFQRPLLVLLDRNMDLATPFHHTWTYQALAHDVLDLKQNRVDIKMDSGATQQGRGARKKEYNLSTATDIFWREHKGAPFPEVADAVQQELDTLKQREGEVSKLKSAMGLDAGDDESAAMSMLSDNTSKLTSAISSLPELMERKRLLDMHTNIATALADQIKARKLDLFFEIEEKLLAKQALQDKSLMDVAGDPQAGTPEDKLRLVIIGMLCGNAIPDSELDQYCSTLEASGCVNNIDAIKYIRRIRTYLKMSQMNISNAGKEQSKSYLTKLMSHGSAYLMEGVKNLVVKKHNLPFTRVVDSLMELKANQEVDDYCYFDPKILRVTDNSQIPRAKQPFQDAVVFVVGGGNYIEYQNLVDYKKGRRGTSPIGRITYGCTELLNADHFLSQLSRLGAEI